MALERLHDAFDDHGLGRGRELERITAPHHHVGDRTALERATAGQTVQRCRDARDRRERAIPRQTTRDRVAGELAQRAGCLRPAESRDRDLHAGAIEDRCGLVADLGRREIERQVRGRIE